MGWNEEDGGGQRSLLGISRDSDALADSVATLRAIRRLEPFERLLPITAGYWPVTGRLLPRSARCFSRPASFFFLTRLMGSQPSGSEGGGEGRGKG